MKFDINQLCCFKKITISYSEDPYHTNGTQLVQEPRKIWMNGKLYDMKSIEEVQFIHHPLYEYGELKCCNLIGVAIMYAIMYG